MILFSVAWGESDIAEPRHLPSPFRELRCSAFQRWLYEAASNLGKASEKFRNRKSWIVPYFQLLEAVAQLAQLGVALIFWTSRVTLRL
jgi:hypothetical protein